MITCAFIAIIVAVPTGIVGAVCMLKLARELNQDQRNGYKINRSAPGWLEGKK